MKASLWKMWEKRVRRKGLFRGRGGALQAGGRGEHERRGLPCGCEGSFGHDGLHVTMRLLCGCAGRFRPEAGRRKARGRSPRSGPEPRAFDYMPFFTSGPLGHWQMGMISTLLMLMCAGRCVTQNTVSAMSCGVMGLVPS